MSDTEFERQSTGGSFVAYEVQASRTGVPVAVGDSVEQVPVYPEVFVAEHPYIKVKELVRSDDGKNINVAFDPASVPVGEGKSPLRRPINANVAAEGRMAKVLQWALDNDTALYIGIEYRRKWKDLSGHVIPYDTPILELRGFDPDTGDSTDAAQGKSRQNISKIVAVACVVNDPRATISDEAKSNPLLWKHFRSNRIGKTPPPEWVRVTRADGTPGGAAIPREQWRDLTGASSSTQIDMNALADAVAERITAANVQPTNAQPTRPPLQGAIAAEGRRWELYNSDGRVNPGSWAVSGALRLRDTALTVLEAVNYLEMDAAQAEGREPNLLSRDQITSVATAMMGALLGVVDQVQIRITGRAHANRIDGSHTTASKVVHQVATRDLPLHREVLDDATAKAAWLNAVRDLAAEIALNAVALTDAYANATTEPVPANDASGRAQRQAAKQNPPNEPSGPQAAAQSQSRPANSAVTQPQTPDFSVTNDETGAPAATATAPARVASVRERNVAVLEPLLAATQLRPIDVMPLIKEQFGVTRLDDVATINLESTVTAWSQDLQRFRDTAEAAYRREEATTKAAG